MKSRLFIPTTFGVMLTAGCGSGLSGDYNGPECPYKKMSFKSEGAVYFTLMGTELRGEYTVDGDKLSISSDGQASVVFTKKGDTLESSVMGMRFTCRKL